MYFTHLTKYLSQVVFQVTGEPQLYKVLDSFNFDFSGHCKKLAPEYAAAATILAN